MDEVEIFFAAVSFDSAVDREAFLRQHAGAEGRMRKVVDDLLCVHDSLASFTEFQEVQMVQNVETPSGDAGQSPLDFLNPSEQKNSLGRLDQYEIVRVLQADPANVVLEGVDTKLKRVVAIRALGSTLRESEAAREQFRRMAFAAAAISSSHVNRILGGGEHIQTPYLVAEVTPGKTLQQRLEQEGACPTTETLRIAREAAQGLADIHGAGLLHGALQPGSILLVGADERVKITGYCEFQVGAPSDVVSADDIADNDGAEDDGAEDVEYQSPEQIRGEPRDERSDLFSLGGIIHTMATGASPFAASTRSQTRRRICEEQPLPIRQLAPHAPAWLEDVILRLLAKDPEHRLQSAQDVVQRFTDHLAPAAKSELPLATSTHRSSWRHRLWRTCDWAVRIAAICVILFATTFVILERNFRGPRGIVLGPIWGAIRGVGSIYVHADDPNVKVTVNSRKMHNSREMHSVLDLDKVWRGSHYFSAPPDDYTVVVVADDEPILNKNVRVQRWGQVDLVINTKEALRELQEKDPDGFAARWLLRRGGTVEGYWHADIRCSDPVRSSEQLPIDRFFLESVELRNLAPADVAVACRLLAACPRLRALRFRDSTLSGASLRHFARLGALQKLELTHVFDADRDDFSALAQAPSLEEISLDYSPHVQAFCSAVGEMPQIHVVAVTDCPLTDVMLPVLCKQTSFESLTIHSRFLTDAALAPLSKMGSLQRLELRSPRLTEDVWSKLAGLPSLQSLKIGGFPAGVRLRIFGESPQAPPRLRELTLTNVSIDDQLLTAVSQWSQLTSLRFEDSIAESDSLQQLAHLAELKSLQFVDTSISLDELLALQNNLPNCEVAKLSDDSSTLR